jgi:alkylhydroperoxidase family enzyme
VELLKDKDLVRGVLQDLDSSKLGDKEKALLRFVEKVNQRSYEITTAEVGEVRRAGWTDEAIFDAITVCALFNFYNRWIDATGVHDMTQRDYDASGKRLAQFGYVME